MQPEHLREIFGYLLRKMLPSPNNSPNNSLADNHQVSGGLSSASNNSKPTAVHIRVFYDILKAPDFIFEVADAYRQEKMNAQIALSVIPVSGLQRRNDFISIVAIKHE